MPPIELPPKTRDLYRHRIEKTLDFITANLAGPLDLERLAREAGFSAYHFHRLFTALVGENPQDYINRLRLERAANLLLKSPALSITQVAMACGFSSPSVFARSFKKYFGLPASQYARQHRGPGAPPAWVSAGLPPAAAGRTLLPPVAIRQMPPLHLAYVPGQHGYTPASIKAAWDRLFQWAAGRQLLTPRASLIAIAFDDPEVTPPHKCRYYAALTVPENVTHDPRINFLDFPAHTCGVCRLDCDPEEIQPAYRAMYRDWLPDSGFLLADLPPYEIYYNAPDNDPTSKYVFDLCIPVELPLT